MLWCLNSCAIGGADGKSNNQRGQANECYIELILPDLIWSPLGLGPDDAFSLRVEPPSKVMNSEMCVPTILNTDTGLPRLQYKIRYLWITMKYRRTTAYVYQCMDRCTWDSTNGFYNRSEGIKEPFLEYHTSVVVCPSSSPGNENLFYVLLSFGTLTFSSFLEHVQYTYAELIWFFFQTTHSYPSNIPGKFLYNFSKILIFQTGMSFSLEKHRFPVIPATVFPVIPATTGKRKPVWFSV